MAVANTSSVFPHIQSRLESHYGNKIIPSTAFWSEHYQREHRLRGFYSLYSVWCPFLRSIVANHLAIFLLVGNGKLHCSRGHKMSPKRGWCSCFLSESECLRSGFLTGSDLPRPSHDLEVMGKCDVEAVSQCRQMQRVSFTEV